MEATTSILSPSTFSSPIPYPKADIPVLEAESHPYSPATILWPHFHKISPQGDESGSIAHSDSRSKLVGPWGRE